jgi:glycogen operon protein
LRAIDAKDIAWLHPDAGEMTAADWQDATLHALGLVLHGNAIEEPGPHGEAVVGDTLAILLNAGQTPVEFDLSRHADHSPPRWETLLDTMHPPDNNRLIHSALEAVPVPERTLLLLRELPLS